MTRDKMRADLAKLLHVEPSEIGDDDNLMDLGLDSMRVMDLLLRWESEGLKTDFSRFFEATTLQEWWQAANGQPA
ncbi:phosphopantetheine-binding protein [Paracoccus aerodenitrificans]|uniref:phosphopantetheine-binding protein n=1 Tax=Paracoccus aerodenitrificans TaxID=3017781 RepID=UPI0022F1033E|nr:phosphopantetheine-binding protein [Paracoccus aerodenitrificans]WBU62868.1 phosphopantetheine-binding protein [Paracoccus aerodenitrificans]